MLTVSDTCSFLDGPFLSIDLLDADDFGADFDVVVQAVFVEPAAESVLASSQV